MQRAREWFWMILGGMNKLITKLFGGIITALLLFLGIERTKNKKQKEKIAKQEVQINHEQQQVQVYKQAHESIVQALKQEHVIEEKQKQQEVKIEESKSDDEVIAIANAIVADFNARH